MKNLLFVISICASIALTACKGNPNTASGDSTGTGAGGARVPGKVSSDTARHDTLNSLTDSSQTKDTSVKK